MLGCRHGSSLAGHSGTWRNPSAAAWVHSYHVHAYASYPSANHLSFSTESQQEGQLPQTESAHLTSLYCTVAVQKAFQSETVYALIASVTKTCVQRHHLPNQYKTTSHFKGHQASAAFHSFRPVFNILVRGESQNWGPQILAPKKLEESLYHTALIYWLRIILFCHVSRVWWTDGTERQMSTARVRSNRVRCALKTPISHNLIQSHVCVHCIIL